jgi:hypothetical protein
LKRRRRRKRNKKEGEEKEFEEHKEEYGEKKTRFDTLKWFLCFCKRSFSLTHIIWVVWWVQMPKLPGGIHRILYEQCYQFYTAAATSGTNYLHRYEHSNGQEDKQRKLGLSFETTLFEELTVIY